MSKQIKNIKFKKIKHDQNVMIVLENVEAFSCNLKNLKIVRDYRKNIREIKIKNLEKMEYHTYSEDKMNIIERLNKWPDICYIDGEDFQWFVNYEGDDINSLQKNIITGNEAIITFNKQIN